MIAKQSRNALSLRLWRTTVVNAFSADSQPAPAELPGQTATCPPDCGLPENSQEHLDAQLDHAIEETFPTSDPVSVMVTRKAESEERSGAVSRTSDRQRQPVPDQAEQETAEELLDHVKEAFGRATQAAYGKVHESYDEILRFGRRARERYPEAERSYRAGRRAVEAWVTENPWPSVLMAGAVGYGLAWMIHGAPRGRERRVPDYARTYTRYASRRDD
jgi:ElaB/YqjD/DUF883 family membrane-anchored ribosome-binding protein